MGKRQWISEGGSYKGRRGQYSQKSARSGGRHLWGYAERAIQNWNNNDWDNWNGSQYDKQRNGANGTTKTRVTDRCRRGRLGIPRFTRKDPSVQRGSALYRESEGIAVVILRQYIGRNYGDVTRSGWPYCRRG